MKTKEILEKILRGEILVNNQELFFNALFKGFLFDIRSKVIVRGKEVPHIVLNTGDDTMFLEVKGQDFSIEPQEVSNENYVYNKVPRANVQFNGVNILTDQLTSPFTRGDFTLVHDGQAYGATAEFRRFPIKVDATVKYYFDNFTDVMEATQSIISSLCFINDFTISYMGQTITSTYHCPDSIDNNLMLEFDGITTDSKNRTIEMTYEIESNLPVFMPRTVILASDYITTSSAALKSGSETLSERDFDGLANDSE